MIRDETAQLIYVDGDVGRLMSVQRALASRRASAATATSDAHLARLLDRAPNARLVVVDASSVDVVAVAVHLAGAPREHGLVILSDDEAGRTRLARERGVVATLAADVDAEVTAGCLAAALQLAAYERVTLPTVLRLAGLARATFALRVAGADAAGRGVMWLDAGAIVDAEMGSVRGPEAVLAMVSRGTCALGIERDTRPLQRTVFFDPHTFLSSFDLPEDEPAIELLGDGSRRARAQRPALRRPELEAVLVRATGLDGVLSAVVLHRRGQPASPRVGLPGRSGAFETELWQAAVTAGEAVGGDVVEDVLLVAGADAFACVQLVEHPGHALWLHVDARRTNPALARIDARRLARDASGDAVVGIDDVLTHLTQAAP